ncbi:MAG: immunoglobulin domain-containing protein [Verrucomicrobiota bacterium]|nr:immunoglobulin domain-containing protein [Verrucomicrobiota bacterium]
MAMNEKLMTAARLHSQDMFNNQFQGHSSSSNPVSPNQPGDFPFERIGRQGYLWQSTAENVYSYADSVFHGHAGFEVDWGEKDDPDGYGMQDPPGHRLNIHQDVYREAGIGVVLGTNGSVGPLLVTQEFAYTRSGEVPFITGVAYYDFNGNSFYDMGEGIGGVRVDVVGEDSYAVTADTGGYTIPVTGNGDYDVKFSGLGFSDVNTSALVANELNTKLDFIPSYTPIIISGDNLIAVNSDSSFSFTGVEAATAYQWKWVQLDNFSDTVGAENSGNDITISGNSSYDVLTNMESASGSYSYHLANPAAETTIVTLKSTIIPSANSSLQFQKRMAAATSDQIAYAQISTFGNENFTTVWSQAGAESPGESDFSSVSISLSEYAGKLIKIQFTLSFESGLFYSNISSGYGLYIDDIVVTNADVSIDAEDTDLVIQDSFTFQPSVESGYNLYVRAKNQSTYYPFSDPFSVRVASGIPVIDTQPASQTVIPGGDVSFSVIASGEGTLSYSWKKEGSEIEMGASETLNISSVSEEGEGDYYCEVSNANATVTSDSATLTVSDPPSITSQPDHQSIDPGDTAFFTVTASGTEPLSYAWKKSGDGTVLSTEQILTIENISESNQGGYYCTVINTQGRVDSFEAQLTVNGSFILTVFEGWNMISVPSDLSAVSKYVSDLFPEVSSNLVWQWEQYYYNYYRELQSESSAGMWINWTGSETNLELPADSANIASVNLLDGWNLIGVPKQISYPSLTNNVGSIWYWDARQNRKEYIKVPYSGSDAYLYPGRAYWIFMTDSETLNL